jgi:MYXO-CTERM domain-containing protein
VPAGTGGYASGGVVGLGGTRDPGEDSADEEADDEGGCGCRTGQRGLGWGWLAGLALVTLVGLGRRRA